MDILGVIVFILFIVIRFLAEANKGKQPGQQRVPRPQRSEEEPWWEEVLEKENRPKPKPTKVILEKKASDLQKEQLRKKDKPVKTKPGEDRLKDKHRERISEKRGNNSSPGIESFSSEFGIDEVRKGVIWAEVLQPPKAKRKKFF